MALAIGYSEKKQGQPSMVIQVRSVMRLLGRWLMVFAPTFIVPALIAYGLGEASGRLFLGMALCTATLGVCLGWRNDAQTCLTPREGCLWLTLAWLCIIALSMVPFHIGLSMPWVDAWFEATSGLTTTGAEVAYRLEIWPKAFLFYHQWLQFLGGLGIVVLASAVLPILAGQGAGPLRGDVPGAMKHPHFLPRVQKTARALWCIYLALYLGCVLTYKVCGLTWFDAVCDAMGTVSTGGFSVHSDSLAHYHNAWLNWGAMVWMLAASLNFAWHYRMVQMRTLRLIVQSRETRAFLTILAMVSLGMAGLVSWHPWSSTLSVGQWLFTIVAMSTTTGLQVVPFAFWPFGLPVLMLLLACIGGCSGSTTGGLKMARAQMLWHDAMGVIKPLLHPNQVLPNPITGNAQTMQAIRGFAVLFILVALFLIFALQIMGVSMGTAFAGVVACFSGVGVSIDALANGYYGLSDGSKLLLSAAMLLGRLEMISILVLCHPSYWTER